MLGGLRLRRPLVWIPTILFALVLTYIYLLSPLLPHSWYSYATRPLWDTSEAPKEHIQHFYADGMSANQLCRIHGWEQRPNKAEVWDATIFSTELDLLLIRLHELSPTVSTFYILESTTTFTGLPKPLLLSEALQTNSDFKPFLPQIKYRTHTGRSLNKGEGPFSIEIEQREAMTMFLREGMEALPSDQPVPVMLFSDVDEIISRRTASLLQACDFSSPLHLGLRDYLYSFEFEAGGTNGAASSWRASAVEWKDRGKGSEEFFRHGKVTERVLVESGWHCSWCFRTIGEFVTKATGYSHADRLGNRPSAILRPSSIQETICTGSDFFHMLPEAYSWREMVSKWRLLASKSFVNAPHLLVEQAGEKRFSYLLPGGCVREDSPWRDE